MSDLYHAVASISTIVGRYQVVLTDAVSQDVAVAEIERIQAILNDPEAGAINSWALDDAFMAVTIPSELARTSLWAFTTMPELIVTAKRTEASKKRLEQAS